MIENIDINFSRSRSRCTALGVDAVAGTCVRCTHEPYEVYSQVGWDDEVSFWCFLADVFWLF